MDKPEEFLPKLAHGRNAIVVYQQEICQEELDVEKQVKQNLKDAEIQSIWGSTIYHIDDIPFKPQDLPHIYGKFREKTAGTKVRSLLKKPEKGDLPFPKDTSKLIKEASEYMPKLEDFGFSQKEIEEAAQKDKRACYDFIGGEDEGMKRCKEYIWTTKALG